MPEYLVLFDGTASRPWGRELLPPRPGPSTLTPDDWLKHGDPRGNSTPHEIERARRYRARSLANRKRRKRGRKRFTTGGEA